MDYCEKIDQEGLLIRLLDKELDPDGENEVLSHMRGCPDCLAKMARVMLTDIESKEAFRGYGVEEDISVTPAITPEPAAVKVMAPPVIPEPVIEPVMKRYNGPANINDLPIGARLDKNIFDASGNLLIAAGAVLSQSLVDGLKRRGIVTVTIRPVRDGREEAYSREASAFKGTPDRGFYTALIKGPAPSNISIVSKTMALESLKKAFAKTGVNASLNMDEIRDTVEDVVDDLTGDDILGPSVVDMYLLDPSLYHHCMNVMIIFTSICSAMNLPLALVKSYAAGAMLHDIGRVFLRQTARAKASQDDIEKYHSEAGYKYLQSTGGLDESVLATIRNHHERLDGKGYPRGVLGAELGYHGQALILANHYENLTWDREQGIKMNFFEAASSIIQQSNRLVDARTVNAFLNVFGHYPPGAWVELSSGEAGMVIQATPFKPRSPLVHIYMDSAGHQLSEALPLNLSHSGSPYVVGPYTMRA